MEFTDKTALVTGGARRIGRSICLALAERGVRVAIHCNTSEEAAIELMQSCPGSVVIVADFADHEVAESVVREAWDRLGKIDILVNNASAYDKTPVEEIDEDAWDRALAVNLKAPFFLARDAGLRMRDAGGGAIVNVTDAAVGRPYPGYLPYFAAKAGLEVATSGLARALAPKVRVNAVAPGPILLPEDSGRAYAESVRKATPLGRLGGADSVVSAVLFLVSNDFVTGSTVCVDGGRSLR